MYDDPYNLILVLSYSCSTSMQEILKRVYELINQENDEKTPYKTKYEANDTIVKYITDNKDKIANDELYILKSIQAQVAYDTQEMHLCRMCLDECEKYIGFNVQHDEIVSRINENKYILLHVLRAFSTRMAVYGNSDNYEDAIKLFKLGSSLYTQFIGTIAVDNDIDTKDSSKVQQINIAYTQFLFISAQIYARSGQDEESAKLCSQTLQLQAQTGQYNFIDFSQHSLDLARYYTNNRIFTSAWELLSCSSYSLAEALISELTKTTIQEKIEQNNDESNKKQQISEILVAAGWMWYNVIPSLPSLTQFSQSCLYDLSKDSTSSTYSQDQISWSQNLRNETPAPTRNEDRPVYSLPLSEQEQLLQQLEQFLKEQKISEKLKEQLNIFWRELGRFYLTVMQISFAIGAQNNQIPASCKCRTKQQITDQTNLEQITPWVFAEYNKQYDLIHLLEQLSDVQYVSIAHSDIKFLIAISESASNALNKSLIYFLLDGWTTEHCKILLDLSYIYDLTANYKPQSYVIYQQKRVRLFETLKGDLNPQYFNDIIEEFEIHLSEAKYDIFEHEYKKLLQMHPYIEQLDYKPKPNDIQAIQKVSIAAANAIQQFQCLIIQVEKAAQSKCRCNRNLNQDAQLEWDQWIRYINSDDMDSYIDAIFKQSVTLSKFPAQTPQQKLQMIERAMIGFQYCEKMWNWKTETEKVDMSENLKYLQEMMTLMRLRIGQIKQLCD